METSAGIVVHRVGPGGVWEVLLIHPAGWFNRRSSWSIPKGHVEPGETPEEAARRETWEEVGLRIDGPLVPLGEVIYKSRRKRVHGFAAPAPEPLRIECKPDEVERAEFFALAEALDLIHEAQAGLLHRVAELLGPAPDPSPVPASAPPASHPTPHPAARQAAVPPAPFGFESPPDFAAGVYE